jgi:serine/threonine protein kinase
VVICGIVMGMRHIHSLGISHNDLRSSNILLDDDWRPLIADFGLSRPRPGDCRGGRNPKTGSSVSREDLQSAFSYIDPNDVFAFGWILYELITGRATRRGDGNPTLPAVPTGSGPVIESLIRRCWSPEPSRPSFGDIFDDFKSREFDILPGADPEAIAAYASEVINKERGLRPGH